MSDISKPTDISPVEDQIDEHEGDDANPHSVTVGQTGGLPAAEYTPEADTHSRPTDAEMSSAAMSHQSIDNPTVSIQLDAGQSTTVPAGEVWQVAIAGTGREGASGTYIQINGHRVGGHDSNARIGFEKVVLVAGDTVACATGSDASLHIGGFVVNDSDSHINIDEPPVSVQLAPGETETVPAGEVWKVAVTTSARNDSAGVYFLVNGSRVLGYDGDEIHGFEQTVFVGGDVIEVDAAAERPAHISGFVVN